MNVAIIGNGPHFYRYFDSLCFLQNVENIDANPNSLENYDIVAITEPFSIDNIMIEKLDKIPKNTLILIEKLPFYTVTETQEFIKKFTNNRLFFVHHRLFEQTIEIPASSVYHVVWPNKYSDNMDPVYHTLPNVIDFAVNQFGFQIDYDRVEWDENLIYLYSEQGTIKVEIVDEKKQNLLSVNGLYLSWPNYMDTYSKMLDQALTDEACYANRQYVISEMKLIEKIRLYMR